MFANYVEVILISMFACFKRNESMTEKIIRLGEKYVFAFLPLGFEHKIKGIKAIVVSSNRGFTFRIQQFHIL